MHAHVRCHGIPDMVTRTLESHQGAQHTSQQWWQHVMIGRKTCAARAPDVVHTPCSCCLQESPAFPHSCELSQWISSLRQ